MPMETTSLVVAQQQQPLFTPYKTSPTPTARGSHPHQQGYPKSTGFSPKNQDDEEDRPLVISEANAEGHLASGKADPDAMVDDDPYGQTLDLSKYGSNSSSSSNSSKGGQQQQPHINPVSKATVLEG